MSQSFFRMDLSDFSARLLTDQELFPRARTLARKIAEAVPGSTALVYTLKSYEEGEVWIAKASAGEPAALPADVPADAGTLGELKTAMSPLLFAGAELSRENYGHLDIRRELLSLGYLPLIHEQALVGAAEILSFREALSKDQLAGFEDLVRIGAAALAASLKYENERNDSLASISRLSQLYDLEKVFASTLEMDELLPIISSKFREVMECGAVNLWLLQPDETVRLMHQSGTDGGARVGEVRKALEGIAGTVSDTGEAILIERADDERLMARNSESPDSRVHSLLAVPIMDKEFLVGVVETVNKLDGSAFDDDDLFALTSLTETASSALHNAGLLMAERKVEILETLVAVSHEITSTLNLERMLQTIVNAPQAVIPYERAAIALERRGRFRLSAVTGVTQINSDAPEIAPLNDILQWAALSEEVVHVQQHGEEVNSDREETRSKFENYFRDTGMRGFYAMPLSDDSGRVGVLSLESSDADFLGAAHIEILQVLAGQATVALRNAQMYKEVAFISILEPVLVRKRRFMALEKRRRTAILALVAAALIFLAIFPLPLRVDGEAVVAPLRRAQVQPEFEGVVNQVFVHEGDAVTRGQVLAEMSAWDSRASLASASAKYQSAMLDMNRALSSSESGEAGVRRVQADYWKSEMDRARELVDKAQLRSPMDGIIATPHVENLAGKRLNYGDSLAEVVDTSRASVDIAIDDVDAAYLRPGLKAVVKLNSYAARTFKGTIQTVSPKGELQGESRVFFARMELPNANGQIRAGMEGRGKVTAGWYPAGYVFFRGPLVWAYSHLWSWFGW